MKKIYLSFASLLVCASASAYVSERSSWSEIFASDAVIVHGFELNNIPLSNACMSDGEIRTIEPMRECVRLVPVHIRESGEAGGNRTEWRCAEYDMVDKVAPRTYTRPVCLDLISTGELGPYCRRTGTEEVTVPSSIMPDIYVSEGDGQRSFEKRFHFPPCPATPN